jgi:hypothetical protein
MATNPADTPEYPLHDGYCPLCGQAVEADGLVYFAGAWFCFECVPDVGGIDEQAAADIIRQHCPDWFTLDKITKRESGGWCVLFRAHTSDTSDRYIGAIFIDDSIQNLLADILEILPTLSEDKVNIYGTDLFKYITGDMMAGKDATKTIATVKLEKLSNGRTEEDKPVVYFQDSKKGWVLNKSSAKAIAEVLGGETDGWRGAQVVLYAEKMNAFGKSLNVIRVRRVIPAKGGKAIDVQDSGEPDDAPALPTI